LTLYSRPDAHKRLVDLLGPAAPSAATLPQIPIPYVLIDGKAIYNDADLVAFAERKRAGAIRRIGGRTRQPADSPAPLVADIPA
jgi:hypothetical protein